MELLRPSRAHLAIGGAAVVVGSALAAAAYADPNGCPWEFTEARGTGNDFEVRGRLWPTGTQCVGYDDGAVASRLDMGPGALECLGWIAFAGLLLTPATRKRTTLLRGAVLGAVLLAMGGILSVWFDAIVLIVVIWLPLLMLTSLTLGETRRIRAFASGVTLLPVVFFAWAVPYLFGYGHLAVAAGIVAGALANVAIERAINLGRRLFPANEFATTT